MEKKKLIGASKKAQEEMMGFALIVIIVAVILLIFIGFSIKQPQRELVESYEAESFVQTALQYTSDCEDNLEYLPIQKLIGRCVNEERCLDGRSTCEVLNDTLRGIIEESWNAGESAAVKGYELNLTSDMRNILFIKKGNETNNYKGAIQAIGRDGVQITFTAYY